tara:strand:+ start:920 stop:1729 length:810 start_codon:yes stop_codon:yes gene_type:complete
MKTGNLLGAGYWFAMRNYVSLFNNVNNSRSSTYSCDGYSLDQDGFAPLPQLDEVTVDRLVDYYLQTQNFQGTLSSYFDEHREHGIVRPKGHYFYEDITLLTEFLDRYGIVQIVKEQLGLDEDQTLVRATIDPLIRLTSERRLVNGYDDALTFHKDVTSLRWVSVFYYLNDVSEGCGHHELFLGTHRNQPVQLRPIRRFSRSELEASLVNPLLKIVVGPKGFGFVENNSLFHRGTIPTKGDRLMLSLRFNDARSAGPIYDEKYARLSEII